MIQFNKIKKPALGITDLIPVGKFKDCRVCDIINEDYEYLIWMNRNNLLYFTKPVIAKLHQLAAFASDEEFFENEVAPYIESDYNEQEVFPDVPF